MIKKLSITLLVVLMLILSLTACTKNLSREEQYKLLASNELSVESIRASFVYGESTIENVTGNAKYVFVGQVIKYSATITNTPNKIPRTVYSVKVIENLKGEINTAEEINVTKGGGLSENYKKVVLFEDDFMPLENEYYIFSCNKNDNNYFCQGALSTIKLEDIENYKQDSDYLKVKLALEPQI